MSDKAKLPETIIDGHNHFWGSMPVEDVLENMDQAGAEMVVMLGLPSLDNDMLVRNVQKHPDKLVGGAYFDLRKNAADAIDELNHYHDEGMKFVKIFPNLGFFPDEDRLLPFWERVAELNMAVLSHCGYLDSTFGEAASYYSHPGRFEKIIRRFSDTPFILAHMGGISGFIEAIMLATRTPNAYVDTAPGQGTWILKHAGEMVISIPPHKIMFGSDAHLIAAGAQVAADKLAAIGFEEHFDKIFYSNIRGILQKIGAVAE